LGLGDDDLDNIQSFWRQNIFPRQNAAASFQQFWDDSVHDGFAEVQPERVASSEFSIGDAQPPQTQSATAPDSFDLVLYQKTGMLDGRHAHNAWLHELSDPVTKAVWDNYVCLAPATASRLGVRDGDVIRVTAGDTTLELPAQVQPGQHDQVVAIALGYGRMGSERFATVGPDWLESKPTLTEGERVGRNSYVFTTRAPESFLFGNQVQITATGKHANLALTQTHHTITVPENLGGHRRDMVRETTVAAYLKDPASGNHAKHEALQLWEEDHKYEGRHWALAIDLSKCTGCSACVVSCQAENNVPVVGKDEVFRRREMAWLRLDRYYSGEDENVDVMFQPVMCQHCDHAPCEGVCPVLATVHSDEGLNQQIYNRCVGTRYCANNCPYKVRRFNWFDYWRKGKRENLALNPDITTRTRGVMEKCSLCVQRIQEAKAESKRLGKPVADGDIKLACEQSCPADAIVFGDMNDPESRISKLIHDPRHYRMLEEMNFRPVVGYMTKVRNRDEEDSEHG
jgi:molybdopterin-containing oxidoreductase family iron-sulfur binding subunit